jgi:hypothetical protein
MPIESRQFSLLMEGQSQKVSIDNMAGGYDFIGLGDLAVGQVVIGMPGVLPVLAQSHYGKNLAVWQRYGVIGSAGNVPEIPHRCLTVPRLAETIGELG